MADNRTGRGILKRKMKKKILTTVIERKKKKDRTIAHFTARGQLKKKRCLATCWA